MTLQYLNTSCYACPTIFEVKLEDGTEAYIKFRFGYIALKREDTHEEIIGEQISDDLDGIISWEDTVKWLNSKNYQVENNNYLV